MKSKVVYAVVVAAYDDEAIFKDFMDSLAMIKFQNFKIIVVSNNRDLDWLKSLVESFKNTVFIQNSGNTGFCHGSNLGIKYALSHGADYILLINGDTLVKKSLVIKLLGYFYRNPKAGLVSPVIMQHPETEKVWYRGMTINKFWGYTRSPGIGKPLPSQIKSEEVDSISGCCVLISRRVLESIGLLDEAFFMYFDDPDISLRAQRAGFATSLFACPLVYHRKINKETFSPLEAYLFGRNPFIWLRKNFSGANYLSAYLGQFFIRLPRNLTRCGNKKTALMYLRGIIDGIRGAEGKPGFL